MAPGDPRNVILPIDPTERQRALRRLGWDDSAEALSAPESADAVPDEVEAAPVVSEPAEAVTGARDPAAVETPTSAPVERPEVVGGDHGGVEVAWPSEDEIRDMPFLQLRKLAGDRGLDLDQVDSRKKDKVLGLVLRGRAEADG